MKMMQGISLMIGAFLLVLGVGTFSQSKTASNSEMDPLSFFIGKWHCDGKFTGSGKSIPANLTFEPVLDGKFILFRHDDEPPFGYHAWAEWGWDKNGKQFVSTIQDVSGGIRLFRSRGWTETNLEWLGGDIPTHEDQRFAFERLGDRSFRVSYSYQKDGAWVPVDTSACTRTETK